MRLVLRLAVIGGVAICATVVAAPRKVLVLPVDGTADPATRTRLGATLQKLAHSIEGHVSIGDTTFADAAAAVGCDPNEPSCADSVLSTLAVDELVWGTATTSNGETVLVVKRATKGAPAKQQQATIATTDAPDKAENDLGPLFGVAPITSLGSAAAGAGSDSAAPVAPARDSSDRNLGIGLAVGGGVAILAGFALWASESSVQDQINSHPTMTLADITGLKSLEDKAGNYAFWGNAMVIIGVGVGAASAYFLWKDHKAQHATTIAPVPPEAGTGMTLVVGGRW